MSDKLVALKEILAVETVEDAITIREKYKDLLLTSDEVAMVNRHWSYLRTKSCIEKSKGDISAYMSCSLADCECSVGKK